MSDAKINNYLFINKLQFKITYNNYKDIIEFIFNNKRDIKEITYNDLYFNERKIFRYYEEYLNKNYYTSYCYKIKNTMNFEQFKIHVIREIIEKILYDITLEIKQYIYRNNCSRHYKTKFSIYRYEKYIEDIYNNHLNMLLIQEIELQKELEKVRLEKERRERARVRYECMRKEYFKQFIGEISQKQRDILSNVINFKELKNSMSNMSIDDYTFKNLENISKTLEDINSNKLKILNTIKDNIQLLYIRTDEYFIVIDNIYVEYDNSIEIINIIYSVDNKYEPYMFKNTVNTKED
jgi:hypothetical protein